jgi:hypothetical protein
VDQDRLRYCSNLQEEFACIKKAYFKKVLSSHPDKGGDPAVFRNVQSAFEVLRELFDCGAVDTFASAPSQSKRTSKEYGSHMGDVSGAPTPSWEYFSAAADEPVPGYRVELARSGRSSCTAKGGAKKCGSSESSVIDKGEIRVGWLDPLSGSYSRWVHLACWRVPSKVWLGLPDPDTCSDADKFETALMGMNQVLLCGVRELPPKQRAEFVRHVMDKSNWARHMKKKPPNNLQGAPDRLVKVEASDEEGDDDDEDWSPEGRVAVKKEGPSSDMVGQDYFGHGKKNFVVPEPGRGRAKANSLDGETVVLTGVFPEVGGGTGLTLGKDRVKRMVEAFGGRVTGSVSGKTTMLVVGKAPGFSKVSQARSKTRCRLVSLSDLKAVVEGKAVADVARKPMKISGFSSGYYGNSVADRVPAVDYDFAATGKGKAAIKESAEEPVPGARKRKGGAAEAPSAKRKADVKKETAAQKGAARKGAAAKSKGGGEEGSARKGAAVKKEAGRKGAAVKKEGGVTKKAAAKKSPVAKKPAASKKKAIKG